MRLRANRQLSDTYKTHWCLFSWQGLFRETDHERSKICIAKISVFILFLALTITACSFMIYLHLWVIARPGAFKLCVLKTVFRMLSFTWDSVTKDAIWFCSQCRTSSVIKQILQIGIVLLLDAFESHQFTANILCIISDKKAVILWKFMQF